jgi:hypothetical protein
MRFEKAWIEEPSSVFDNCNLIDASRIDMTVLGVLLHIVSNETCQPYDRRTITDEELSIFMNRAVVLGREFVSKKDLCNAFVAMYDADRALPHDSSGRRSSISYSVLNHWNDRVKIMNQLSSRRRHRKSKIQAFKESLVSNAVLVSIPGLPEMSVIQCYYNINQYGRVQQFSTTYGNVAYDRHFFQLEAERHRLGDCYFQECILPKRQLAAIILRISCIDDVTMPKTMLIGKDELRTMIAVCCMTTFASIDQWNQQADENHIQRLFQSLGLPGGIKMLDDDNKMTPVEGDAIPVLEELKPVIDEFDTLKASLSESQSVLMQLKTMPSPMRSTIMDIIERELHYATNQKGLLLSYGVLHDTIGRSKGLIQDSMHKVIDKTSDANALRSLLRYWRQSEVLDNNGLHRAVGLMESALHALESSESSMKGEES